MSLTGAKVEEWLKDHNHKKFVSVTDIRDDIDAPDKRLGRALKDLTDSEWGGSPPQYVNPYYSEEAHREHFENMVHPNKQYSGLEEFQYGE